MVKPKKAKKQARKKNVMNQKTKVSQNVKIVIGDTKRKVARKTSAKPTSKPPMVINVSAPQPQLSNPYFQFFKDQLANQAPIKGDLALKEQQETKASKAGLLGKLQQEPDDVQRELVRQAAEMRKQFEEDQQKIKQQQKEFANSLKSNKKRIPKRKTAFRPLETSEDANPWIGIRPDNNESDAESNMLIAMEEQTAQIERVMPSKGEFFPEQEGAGADKVEDTPPAPTLERQRSQRGPKKSDLPTPNPNISQQELLETLSEYDDRALQRKLKGSKLKEYMQALGMRTHEKGKSNPTSVADQRQAIIDRVYLYKRQRDMGK
jgi:hypothetical protein